MPKKESGRILIAKKEDQVRYFKSYTKLKKELNFCANHSKLNYWMEQKGGEYNELGWTLTYGKLE